MTPHEGSAVQRSGSAPVPSAAEDSPSGLGRTIGNRVGLTPSGVQIPYPPPIREDRALSPGDCGHEARDLYLHGPATLQMGSPDRPIPTAEQHADAEKVVRRSHSPAVPHSQWARTRSGILGAAVLGSAILGPGAFSTTAFSHSPAGSARALSTLASSAPDPEPPDPRLDGAMVFPLIPFYALKFHASPTTIGMIIASFFVAQLVSAPIWGRVSEHTGRRPALLVSLSASAAAFWVFGFANTVWLLFLCRIVQGTGGGTTGVLQAYIADTVPAEDRARSLGWLSAGTNVGTMLGPVIGSFAT